MSYQLLIVDDSATARAMTKRAISKANIPVGRIFEVDNGREALDFLADHPVDLVLAELNTPEMDGVEMIGRLLAEPSTRSIPVIIISSKPDPAIVERLRRSGARGCLRKPCAPEVLRTAIAQILEPTHV